MNDCLLVSCLCPCFNRYPNHADVVEEAVQSFLLQDYPFKELIVCNDTPQQWLDCHAPGVRVLNLGERFPTLSAKLQWMIDQADGDILCRWDDDDISLPWRLSLSIDKLGDGLEWRSENHWYSPNNRPESITQYPGNSHTMAVWRREVLDRIGGYPADCSGWEDQEFNQALRRAGIRDRGDLLPDDEIFYLYRWGVSDQHLSGVGGDHANLQRHWDAIGNQPVFRGGFTVRPRWRKDYVALTRSHNR